MMEVDRSRTAACLLAAALIVGVCALPGLALAQGAGPITVPFSDFQPQSPAAEECAWDPIGGSVEATDNPGPCCLVAPVYLPDGEHLQFFFVYFEDSTSENFSLVLRRKELGTLSASEVVTSITTNTASAGVKALIGGVVPALQEVDNLTYSYYLSTDSCLVNGSHGIYSATLTFFD
jgi:hypothetical protein